MRVTINGNEHDLPPRANLAEAAVAVGVHAADRGVAAALDGAVVPRAAWGSTPLAPGASIEVVRAAAGG